MIGVFWDSVFSGQQTPPNLSFEDFARTWGCKPGVRVVPLDAHQIRSYTLLFKGKMDVLVFPYGSVFPMDAYQLYFA